MLEALLVMRTRSCFSIPHSSAIEKLTHICTCVAIIHSFCLKHVRLQLPLTADIMSCNGHIWDCSSGCPGIARYCYPVSRVEKLLHGKLCLLLKIWNRFKCENVPGWNNVSWLQTVDHVAEASKRRTPVCITIYLFIYFFKSIFGNLIIDTWSSMW